MSIHRSRKLKYQPPSPAYLPANAPLKIIGAIQNLAAGEASAHQQKMALEWIIRECSGQGPTFRPGGVEAARESDFAQGRRFVGEQIVGLLRINIIALDPGPPEPPAEHQSPVPTPPVST